MNADGNNPTRLTHGSGEDTFPHWSPDGKQIVYTSGIGGGMWDNILGNGSYEIYVMNADGSNPIQLTNSPGGWMIICIRVGRRMGRRSSSGRIGTATRNST